MEKQYEITSIKKGKVVIKAEDDIEASLKAENINEEAYTWENKVEIQSIEEVDYS